MRNNLFKIILKVHKVNGITKIIVIIINNANK